MNNYEYISQYQKLHKESNDYGSSSPLYFDELCLFIDYLKPTTVLDYGCGKGALLNILSERYPDITFLGYDPAIPERETLPVTKADLIINTDVLEHIPETILPTVLKEISTISEHVVFCLHHALARITLSNGENAHCTVKPPVWYHQTLMKYFQTITTLPGRKGYLSLVATFPISQDLFDQYYTIIYPPKEKAETTVAEGVGEREARRRERKQEKKENNLQRLWRHIKRMQF